MTRRAARFNIRVLDFTCTHPPCDPQPSASLRSRFSVALESPPSFSIALSRCSVSPESTSRYARYFRQARRIEFILIGATRVMCIYFFSSFHASTPLSFRSAGSFYGVFRRLCEFQPSFLCHGSDHRRSDVTRLEYPSR